MDIKLYTWSVSVQWSREAATYPESVGLTVVAADAVSAMQEAKSCMMGRTVSISTLSKVGEVII